MKLERLSYDPGAALDFYEQGLTHLGALCERTWHDRLEVLAEGLAASLWNRQGEMHSGELHFAPADTKAARDASREVFPGCPLTFRLAEAQRPSPLSLDRLVLAASSAVAPELPVAEKLWCNQYPGTGRWRLVKPFVADFHFSLLALIRCEVQAIDQHWSLHRVAVTLPGGEPDEDLARQLNFASVEPNPQPEPVWPKPDPVQWRLWLQAALEPDLMAELRGIRTRQENSLKRELERVDDYFDQYERELTERGRRSSKEGVKHRTEDRLAAAKAEHARRRADQVARHEIRVHPHLEAVLLIAEPAWRAELHIERSRQSAELPAWYVPRARRWHCDSPIL
ncbi:MAG TPA: hypothetical protein VJA21_25500 [Verrucomicrobiae bacterium]